MAKLNKEGKFSEALSLFKENKSQFTPEQIAKDSYLISRILTSLRKTGDCNSGFKFLELYKINIDENVNEIILIAYGWLLYSAFKSESQYVEDHNLEADIFDDEDVSSVNSDYDYTKSKIIEKIELFLPLIIKIHNDFAYSVISNLFKAILKIEKKKINVSWKFISDFCDFFSPDMLHTDCDTIEVEVKGKKKPMELASDKEIRYAYKTKALTKLGQWEECYKLSKQAIEIFDKFHYSNDARFARRMAISKKNLGNPEDALQELLIIIKRKKEWFVQAEIAELYKSKGDTESSFKYAIDSINNFGDLEYKVNLLILLGDLLKMKGENELLFKHYSLSLLLRKTKKWPITPILSTALASFSYDPISIDDINKLNNELKKYRDSFKPKIDLTDKAQGEIIQILHDNERGKDGFLLSNNKKYYFYLSSKFHLTTMVSIGTVVDFVIEENNDDKNRPQIKIVSIVKS